jgi:hypothetical protein
MSALGTAVRLCAVVGAAAALAASGSSSANRPPPPAPQAQADAPPPQSQPMDPQRAVGLWKSSFGPVKIERDVDTGPGHLMGIWVYDRQGREVVGYFGGPISGNVMQFRWQEPARPRDLVGEGYLVFDPQGQSFSGRWWTTARDRGGDWQGWRHDARAQPPGPGHGPPPDQGPAEQGPPPDQGPAEQAPGPPPDQGPAEQAPGPAEQAPGPPPEGPPEQGPPQEGPAEQAPGPPPEDI